MLCCAFIKKLGMLFSSENYNWKSAVVVFYLKLLKKSFDQNTFLDRI